MYVLKLNVLDFIDFLLHVHVHSVGTCTCVQCRYMYMCTV